MNKNSERDYKQVDSLHELDGWLSAEKAAELLNMHHNSIRKMVAAGDLVARRWGGHTLMISRASVDAYNALRRSPGRPKTTKN